MSRTRSPTDAPLFDRLPDTIVSDIFELTWRNWKCDSSLLWGGIGRFSVPYILASVSRRWRTIALSTSRIWRFVELPRRPELIEDHLARSRSLPLDIDIGLVWTEDGDKAEDRGADIQESLRILMETNSWARIEGLHSRLNNKQTSLLLADFNATIEANPVSTVQMINIQPHYTDYDDDDDPIEMFLRIPHSQSLCWVNLESVAVSPIPHLPSSPLLGLEQLEIKDTDVQLSDSLLPLLDLTPNLADLLIEGCQLLPGMLTAAKPRPRHSLLLSNLETLSLDCTGITGLNMLFQTLDMPDLKHLSITRVDRGTNIDWDAICHCHAVEFLSLPAFSLEELSRLLVQIHNLGQLEYFYYGFNLRSTRLSGFINQLVFRLLDTSCCTALRKLCLNCTPDEQSRERINELRSARPSLDISNGSLKPLIDPLDVPAGSTKEET